MTPASALIAEPPQAIEVRLKHDGEQDSDNFSVISANSTASTFSLAEAVIKPILDHLQQSAAQREKERMEREKQREERERERKWHQFKKDEAFVMDVMNRELEREQAILARKREKKETAARRELELKLQEQQRALQEQRKRKETASKRMRKSHQRISQYLTSPSANKEGWVIEVDTNASQCDSTAEMEDSEWDPPTSNSNKPGEYQKTIRWCLSVDDEQERRRVHRLTHPVKKGGIARRVRRNPDRYQKKTVEEIEKENANNPEEQPEETDPESIEDMVDEYRRSAGLPTMEEDSLEDSEDDDSEEDSEEQEQPVQDDSSASSSSSEEGEAEMGDGSAEA